MYIKEDDVKPEDFPEDYADGYPCYYFQWNVEEAGQSTKKVIVVPMILQILDLIIQPQEKTMGFKKMNIISYL